MKRDKLIITKFYIILKINNILKLDRAMAHFSVTIISNYRLNQFIDKGILSPCNLLQLMTHKAIPNPTITANYRRSWRYRILSGSLILAVAISWLLALGMPPAFAGINDDHYDGNIFALYGGNGSLVPPKVDLSDSFLRKKPALLVFYVDDSSDCKQYATVVSNLQQYYGRAADFIPISVDALPAKPSDSLEKPSHYYEGVVPQTVLIDESGKVAFNAKGLVAFEEVDDAFRKVFDLLPRAESIPLKRRIVNEFNTELSK